MVVVSAEWRLRLPEARSLKEKRMVLRSLKDRIRRLNVSVAEVGDQDHWGSARLAVALVAGDAGMADSVLSKVDQIIEREARVIILDLRRSTL